RAYHTGPHALNVGVNLPDTPRAPAQHLTPGFRERAQHHVETHGRGLLGLSRPARQRRVVYQAKFDVAVGVEFARKSARTGLIGTLDAESPAPRSLPRHDWTHDRGRQ